jgi:hypothetical protein
LNLIKCNISKDYSRLIGVCVALFLILFASSCLEGVNGQKSGRPISTQQIRIDTFPVALFGNACDFSDLEAIFNPLLTPNGATIQVALTGSTLPFNLRGCITFFDPVVIDGRADVEYLSGPLIGVGDLGFVNVAVTSTLQSGASDSSFATLVIEGVGIVSITGPDMITSGPDAFATIQVDTFGILPGTVVNFQLTNNSCGSLSNPTPVLGSVFEGVAIVEYDPVDGTECSQTVIVTIVLPDPPTKDPDCDSIPVEDRTIQASISFDQLAPPPPTPTPTPSPTPTPGPTPTPTPPPSIEVTVANGTLEPNGSTIATATTMNAPPATDVCCDIPIDTDPMSLLGSPPAAPPDCGFTDINGEFFTVLTCGNVVTLQTLQLRCCIDDSGGPNGQCDQDDIQNSTFVDCNPAGAPPPIELIADPSSVSPEGTTNVIAMTDPAVAAGINICFKIIINSTPNSMLFFDPTMPLMPDETGCMPASSLGEAVIGLLAGNVLTPQSVTVQGCIDTEPNNLCDGANPSAFVTVPIVLPAPTPTPAPTPAPPMGIAISSTNLAPLAGGNTIIDVTTNPSANNCVRFVVNSSTPSMLDTIPSTVPSATEVCEAAVLGQNSYLLNVDGTATGQQIRVEGCIDTMALGCGDEPPGNFSNQLTFFVQ